MKSTSFRRAIVPGIAALALALTACGGDDAEAPTATERRRQRQVTIDGSSTVFPMTRRRQRAAGRGEPRTSRSAVGAGRHRRRLRAVLRRRDRHLRRLAADRGGRGRGAARRAASSTPSSRSPPTRSPSWSTPTSTVDCLTIDQLDRALGARAPRSPTGTRLDPSFPDQEISLFGPGTDSGTYDYLAADVIGDESETTRDDYEASEDDNVLVQGVAGTEGATGYFGYTYYEENADTLKAVAIDDGDGCVEPSAETARRRRVHPAVPAAVHLRRTTPSTTTTRRSRSSSTSTSRTSPTIAEAAQFIPLNEEQYAETQSALEGIVGLTESQTDIEHHDQRPCRPARRGGPAPRAPLDLRRGARPGEAVIKAVLLVCGAALDRRSRSGSSSR